MSILVINAGSSSVKMELFDFQTLESTTQCLIDWAGRKDRATITRRWRSEQPERQTDQQTGKEEMESEEIETASYREGVTRALELLLQPSDDKKPTIRAIGHRLIHGGEEIRSPVRIDAAMKKTIARYEHLAPLHIPAGLEAIEAVEAALPGIPQAGLFDTAFFADIPPAAYLYPLPYQWYTDWGIRRFGFHGTSHAYCTMRATEMLREQKGEHPPTSPRSRFVICHLGQGSSATAVRDGVALTNTMGFTPLEGLVMGTRCGTVDPGILVHVQRAHGMTAEELEKTLHNQSGLLGLSGVSSDFRKVEAAAAEGHEQAKLALSVYAYRIREMIGALAVTLGGVDALIFTGGIGENATQLRAEVCQGLECLGIHLDQDKNNRCHPDTNIATQNSPASIQVIHTQEALMIAQETRRLVLATDEIG